MTTEKREIANCPECGRQPVFGAEFCPYCGTPLPAPDRKKPEREIEPLPDPDKIDEPCALLLSGSKPLDIPRAGRIIAGEMRRPLTDVTREMKVSRGILARSIDADLARNISRQLAGLGVETIIEPESKMQDFPPLMRIKSAGFDENGLECDAYAWDATEEVKPAWSDIIFASGARIIVQEVQQIEETDKDKKKSRVPKLQTLIRHEYVLDIFCRRPWLRLRLDENTSAYALMMEAGSFTGGKSGFYRTARRMMRFASDLPVNAGVRYLAEGAPDEVWDQLSFDDKREFDTYNTWLLQLARYGLPFPEED